MFGRVADEVLKNTAESWCIAADRRQAGRQFDLNVTTPGADFIGGRIYGFVQDLANGDGLPQRGGLVFLRASKFEHLFDHFSELVGVFENEARILFDLSRFTGDAAKEIVTRTANDGERSAKFVGDVGDEVHLGFGKLAGAAGVTNEGEAGSQNQRVENESDSTSWRTWAIGYATAQTGEASQRQQSTVWQGSDSRSWS